MNNTEIKNDTAPELESEVVNAICKKLYGDIIDLLNAEQRIHFGNKMRILAGVVDTSRQSIKDTHPELADQLARNFLMQLLSLENQD